MTPNDANPIGPKLLGHLLDCHGPALELYARQLCRTADDAVQEAFVELARQRTTPDDPAAWLYQVVRNKALSAVRAAGRRRRHETLAAAQRSEWFVESGATGLDVAAVTAALETLSQTDREVLVMHIWGGRTFGQIGRLLGISDSTAHRRYVATLGALRERLGVVWQKNH